jgi:hypothetical protein
MSTEPEQPAYQNYPAMPPAQAAPWTPGLPPGLPYGAPPGWRPGVNGFAVTSLVLGILGPVGGLVLGLVFGIIALSDIKRTGQRGRGLAIAGVALSSVWIFLVIVFVGLAIIGAALGPTTQSSGSTGFSLKPGQCFDRDANSKSADVTVIDCAKPHDAEAFATEPITSVSYPGLAAVQSIGERRCPADADRWLTAGLNYPDFAVHYLYPQESSWTRGDRTVICFFRRVDNFPIAGHVKDTGLPYSADQKRYLDAIAPYDKIVDDEYDAPTWTSERDVVVRSLPVLQKEIDVLKAGPWPTNAQASIDALVAAKQLELGDRQRAAAATDSNGLDDALADADDHDGTDEDTAIRTALHLAPR